MVTIVFHITHGQSYEAHANVGIQILYANDIMRVFHTQMHKHRYTWDLMLWSEARRQKFVSANKFDLK